MSTRRLLLQAAAPLAAAVALPRPALAAFPERPLRIIVPFAAGGITDLLARIVTTRMAERLGSSAVIENRVGAGGSIGAELVTRAAPDGYTLLFGSGGPLTANPVLQARLSYDVERDFQPIGLVGILPMVCQASSRLGVTTLTDFFGMLRERPGQVTVATPGNGSAAHLALELMLAGARVRASHVPYRGGSAMMPDLISGTVDAGFVELPSALPLHREGKVRIIAVATTQRSPLVPEVQTFIEAGLPGYTAGSFGGLLLPAGAPQEVRAALHGALTATLAEPGVQARISEVGAILGSDAQRTPEGFAAFLRTELENARRAAELAGLGKT
ncbi:tripartite tricarboxylate transporter substrate binding protein [Roseomonas sp. SSH11]|uniref:Tripartite tricarboxylate transporter substrate binding protein n=1 Tax=Pararoseomonas baculiformis TaxID=2820812 RepID=A0ABS4AKM0_9PROT|nr:tripartite tricarboxylate transporter substrate binding protein [Pararoseomonas baculiformis]MBP0447584.1 tripartite tricarboxylate transporter substrate binding protein [Pararoseomonas baculiformis]